MYYVHVVLVYTYIEHVYSSREITPPAQTLSLFPSLSPSIVGVSPVRNGGCQQGTVLLFMTVVILWVAIVLMVHLATVQLGH